MSNSKVTIGPIKKKLKSSGPEQKKKSKKEKKRVIQKIKKKLYNSKKILDYKDKKSG